MPSYNLGDSTITFCIYLSISISLNIFVTIWYAENKTLHTVLHWNKCYFGVSFLRGINLQVKLFCFLICYNTKCSNIIFITHVNGRGLEASLQQALSDIQCPNGIEVLCVTERIHGIHVLNYYNASHGTINGFINSLKSSLHGIPISPPWTPLCNTSGVGVTKLLSSVLLFSSFFTVVKHTTAF